MNLEKYYKNGKWHYKGWLQYMNDHCNEGFSIKPLLNLLKRNPNIRCYYLEEQYKKFMNPDGWGCYQGLPSVLYREKMFNESVLIEINKLTTRPSIEWNCDCGRDIKPHYELNGLYGYHPEIYNKLWNGDYKLLTMKELNKRIAMDLADDSINFFDYTEEITSP